MSGNGLHWLFLAVFPNGGSTAFARMLGTSPRALALRPNHEGQWLIPELSADGRRWDPELAVDLHAVRRIWTARALEVGAAPGVVIEKSPPNLCRMGRLIDVFGPGSATLVRFPRDPYAVCASWAARYRPETIVREWYPQLAGRMTTAAGFLHHLARIWVLRARMMVRLEPRAALTLSYEDLTADPGAAATRILAACPALERLDPGAAVKVKDYAEQPLTNMNEAQIGRLRPHHVEHITRGLAPFESTLAALGYKLR